MPDLIPSEATTAGAIRQSVEAGERCPKCGAPFGGTTDMPTRGTLQRRSRTVFQCRSTRYNDDGSFFEHSHCLRRQLAQAKERAEKAEHDAIGYKVVRDRYAQWAAEWEDRYNRLRRLL